MAYLSRRCRTALWVAAAATLAACTPSPEESAGPVRPGVWRSADGRELTLDENGGGHTERLEVAADGEFHFSDEEAETEDLSIEIRWTIAESEDAILVTREVGPQITDDRWVALGPDGDRWKVLGYWACGDLDTDPPTEYTRQP